MSKDTSADEFIISELARLRRDVDKLLRAPREEAILIHSNKTTRTQRQSLRDHVENLDKIIKLQKAVPIEKDIAKNTFKIGQVVELDLTHSKGKIQYIACKLALPSYNAKAKSLIASALAKSDETKSELLKSTLPKACDRRTCNHNLKNYVWVVWPNQKVFAYHFGKLRLMSEDELKPQIGKELSGRVGPWLYDAATKLWKKDGSEKTYSQEEFADAMYFEQHPYAKEEGAEFIKMLTDQKKKF